MVHITRPIFNFAIINCKIKIISFCCIFLIFLRFMETHLYIVKQITHEILGLNLSLPSSGKSESCLLSQCLTVQTILYNEKDRQIHFKIHK